MEKPIKELTLKYKDILGNFENTVNHLANSRDLPTKVSFQIARLIRQLSPAYEDFNKKRTELLERYSEPVDDAPDQRRFVDRDKQNAFTQAMAEIGESELLFSIRWRPFSIDDFSSIKLSPIDLLAIEVLMDENFLDDATKAEENEVAAEDKKAA